MHFAELAPELDKKYKKLYTKDKLGSIFAIFKYSHFDTFNNSNNALKPQTTIGSQKILGSQKIVDLKIFLDLKTIPVICHFFYTGKIFRDKILHPKARKYRQNGFRDKIA